jgi:DTW domain-containing protein YfiP
MAHLCLQRSHLIWGDDFSHDNTVNAILSDPARHCVVLYPGPDSQDISAASLEDRAKYIPNAKALTVFVIDGTWRTAKKMLRLSENLKTVPKISFIPTRASAFKIRKQPAANCLSTIEAIHQTIDLLGQACGYDLTSRSHDELLRVFQTMVVRQLRYTPDAEPDELNPTPKVAVSIRNTLD